jgi:hypothetical protein
MTEKSRQTVRSGLLLAALSALIGSVLIGIVSGGFSRPSYDQSVGNRWVTPRQLTHDSEHAPAESTTLSDAGCTRILRANVAPGSIVVLQSIDLTGSRHGFFLRAASCSGTGSTGCDGVQQSFAESTVADGVFAEVPRGATIDFFSAVLTDTESPEVSGAVTTLPPSTSNFRRLLLPRFTDRGLNDLAVDCPCIHRGAAVTVYLDPEVPPTESRMAAALCASLESHLQRTAGTLRTCMESGLGSIDDIDGDGRLTVVLTHLDKRNPGGLLQSDRVPVLGCVREADFLGPQTEACGDILYLAPEGLHMPGSTSLLAHELAHAAVHCRQRQRLQRGQQKLVIPDWFHEALAHLAEHSVAGAGEFFEQRLAEFQLGPQTCPVVTGFQSGWEAGRGGSRPAGLLFLQSAIRRPVNVPQLFHTSESFAELLDGLLRQSFRESVAAWGPVAAGQILRARPQAITRLRAGAEHSGSIYGTAFQCWRSDYGPLTIEIQSDAAAALQLTVLTFNAGATVTAAD